MRSKEKRFRKHNLNVGKLRQSRDAVCLAAVWSSHYVWWRLYDAFAISGPQTFNNLKAVSVEGHTFWKAVWSGISRFNAAWDCANSATSWPLRRPWNSSKSCADVGRKNKYLKQLLMYAFYFSKTIYNTSKIKNVANKKVFSTSLNLAVTSSRTTHWLIPSHQSTHPDTSLGHSSDSCVSKVTITLSNDGCIYECVLLVAACNVILCSAFNTYSMFFVGL